MNRGLATAFSTFDDVYLADFAKQQLQKARELGREQAKCQRAADAARKEIKRRKQGTP